MSDTTVDIETQDEIHPNGQVPPSPPAIAYVETADEKELHDLIDGLNDTVEVLLDIPEWKVRGADGTVRVIQVLVRALTADERIEYIKLMQQSNVDLKKLYPDIAIMTALHPITKKPIWKGAAERGALLKKHGMAIERIATLASEISGLSEEALKSLRKN